MLRENIYQILYNYKKIGCCTTGRASALFQQKFVWDFTRCGFHRISVSHGTYISGNRQIERDEKKIETYFCTSNSRMLHKFEKIGTDWAILQKWKVNLEKKLNNLIDIFYYDE